MSDARAAFAISESGAALTSETLLEEGHHLSETSR